MKQKTEFANIEINILITPTNKAAVRNIVESLAIWGAIGPYEKKDILERIDEVGR